MYTKTEFGSAVKHNGLGNGMDKAYYRLGNIGWWLRMQREIKGLTRTQVADKMSYPRGAVKDIEEGRRIPQASTVEYYLNAIQGIRRTLSGDMYGRFNG